MNISLEAWLILANIAVTIGLYWRTRRVIVMRRADGTHAWTTRKAKNKDRK